VFIARYGLGLEIKQSALLQKVNSRVEGDVLSKFDLKFAYCISRC
jgi:hypothetical protein